MSSRLLRSPSGPDLGSLGLGSSETSSASSSYIIYRDHKYYSLAKRVFHYSLVLIRFYVTEPGCRKLRAIQNYVLELCGLLLLLLTVPLLCVTALCVHVSRRLRIRAIRRFYPQLDVCDDFSVSFEVSDGEGTNSPIVTATVWLNGRVTAQDLRDHYTRTLYQRTRQSVESESVLVPILQKCISSKFGIAVTSTSTFHPFNIGDHIREAVPTPAIVYNPLAHDIDEHSQQGHRARLQRLIGSALSKKMEPESRPPWNISLIPVHVPPISTHGTLGTPASGVKTCCILRFHPILLKDPAVSRFLEDVFLQNSGRTLRAEVKGQEPLEALQKGIHSLMRHVSWLSKQKLATLFQDFVLFSWSWTRISKFGLELHRNAHAFVVLLRSLSSIPIEVLQSALAVRVSRPERTFGVSPQPCDSDKNGDKSEREICWSAAIDGRLVESVLERIRASGGVTASTESVILCAVSMGLSQYYVETCLPNPGTLRVAISSAESGFKSVTIRTQTMSRSTYGVNEKYVLWSNLLPAQPYPAWKVYGSSYFHAYVSHCLPRRIASVLVRRSYQRHPLQLTCIGPPEGGSSLWGHSIDEISIWSSSSSPPVSICLVESQSRGSGQETMRLVVQVNSRMKFLASCVARHLDTYLTEIAETVGVRVNLEKHKVRR